MKGIDIASMQGAVDFAKVKASGIEIVYIKATEGLTYDNPYMKSQYQGAKAQGLRVGFYHYLKANNPVSEAEHFINVTKGYAVDCLYGIDAEVVLGQTGAQISSNIRRFADTLINKKLEVCIYTGDAFYDAWLNSTVRNIPVWIAHYGVSQPDYKGYVGFQYSESGKLNGVTGDVDLDVFTNGIYLSTVSKIVVATVPQPIVIKPMGNPRIRLLQQLLNAQGFTDNHNKMLIVDGFIQGGTSTREACAKCMIKRGAEGEITRWVQTFLQIKADGCYGKAPFHQMYDAVIKYQKLKGLPADSTIGPNTWNKILNQFN